MSDQDIDCDDQPGTGFRRGMLPYLAPAVLLVTSIAFSGVNLASAGVCSTVCASRSRGTSSFGTSAYTGRSPT